MRLKLNSTPEQIELIKAMASKDSAVATAAQEAFAALASKVVMEVIGQAGTASMIYRDMEYAADENPSIPLDLFYDQAAGYVSVWSQALNGGLASNSIEGVADMKLSTYRLDSAINIAKKYIRKSRLNVVAKGLERLSQELLLKQERNAWNVILKALGEASTNNVKHTITSATESVFIPQDLNRLQTLMKRMNMSFANGTPDNKGNSKVTDLFVSYEITEAIRGYAYNPVNSVGSQSTGPVTLPEGARSEIWRAGGTPSLWGITIHELAELGISRKYNTLFTQYATSSIGHGGDFATADDELLLGFDLVNDAFIRPIAVDADSGSTVVAEVDDQYVKRADKVGWFVSLEEGRVCIDARKCVGLVV
jgi:hypothetical protein